MGAGRTSVMRTQIIMRAQARREGEVRERAVRERAHERSVKVMSNRSGAHKRDAYAEHFESRRISAVRGRSAGADELAQCIRVELWRAVA